MTWLAPRNPHNRHSGHGNPVMKKIVLIKKIIVYIYLVIFFIKHIFCDYFTVLKQKVLIEIIDIEIYLLFR